jgi:hypothetical protein
MVISHTPSWRPLPTHVILCRHEDDGLPSAELSRGTRLPSSLSSSSQYTAPSLGAAVSTSTERWTRAVQHCGPQHCRIQNIKQMRSSEKSSSTRYPLFHGGASRVGIVTRLMTERRGSRPGTYVRFLAGTRDFSPQHTDRFWGDNFIQK